MCDITVVPMTMVTPSYFSRPWRLKVRKESHVTTSFEIDGWPNFLYRYKCSILYKPGGWTKVIWVIRVIWVMRIRERVSQLPPDAPCDHHKNEDHNRENDDHGNQSILSFWKKTIIQEIRKTCHDRMIIITSTSTRSNDSITGSLRYLLSFHCKKRNS